MKDKKGLEDISPILRHWSYDDDDSEENIRRLRMPSGREVMQVRLPLGVEQYEMNGRPDGLKPEGSESWLHHYRHQATIYGREFVLDDESCARLQAEGILYYYRYLRFFQIQEYELCMRDTSRNLQLLDFVRSHAGRKEHVETLDQYRPYILRMQLMAKALLRLKEREDYRGALRILKEGLESIKGLPEVPGNEIFQYERTRSLHSLEDLIGQIEIQASVHCPPTRREKLQTELQTAVDDENYERAALLRDKLRKLNAKKRS